MEDKYLHESELIEELKQMFGAKVEHYYPSKEEEEFLEERQKIFELYCWDFKAFVKHYQLIKEYGVDNKCLETLAWKIEYVLDDKAVSHLTKSEFYSQFGEYKIIRNALLKHEIH